MILDDFRGTTISGNLHVYMFHCWGHENDRKWFQTLEQCWVQSKDLVTCFSCMKHTGIMSIHICKLLLIQTSSSVYLSVPGDQVHHATSSSIHVPIPLGNQTWRAGKWIIEKGDVPLPKPPFIGDVPLPCLMTSGWVFSIYFIFSQSPVPSNCCISISSSSISASVHCRPRLQTFIARLTAIKSTVDSWWNNCRAKGQLDAVLVKWGKRMGKDGKDGKGEVCCADFFWRCGDLDIWLESR